MKVKTSITLSQDLLRAADVLAPQYGSRSELMETALRAFIDDLERRRRDALDADILDRQAERMNAEAREVLGYQADLATPRQAGP
jgi:metal-responsive CopG/Arc/MetJ family transcriptional regulator